MAPQKRKNVGTGGNGPGRPAKRTKSIKKDSVSNERDSAQDAPLLHNAETEAAKVEAEAAKENSRKADEDLKVAKVNATKARKLVREKEKICEEPKMKRTRRKKNEEEPDWVEKQLEVLRRKGRTPQSCCRCAMKKMACTVGGAPCVNCTLEGKVCMMIEKSSLTPYRRGELRQLRHDVDRLRYWRDAYRNAYFNISGLPIGGEGASPAPLSPMREENNTTVTVENTEDNAEDNTEDNAQGNAEDNAQGNAEDNTVDNTVEQDATSTLSGNTGDHGNSSCPTQTDNIPAQNTQPPEPFQQGHNIQRGQQYQQNQSYQPTQRVQYQHGQQQYHHGQGRQRSILSQQHQEQWNLLNPYSAYQRSGTLQQPVRYSQQPNEKGWATDQQQAAIQQYALQQQIQGVVTTGNATLTSVQRNPQAYASANNYNPAAPGTHIPYNNQNQRVDEEDLHLAGILQDATAADRDQDTLYLLDGRDGNLNLDK